MSRKTTELRRKIIQRVNASGEAVSAAQALDEMLPKRRVAGQTKDLATGKQAVVTLPMEEDKQDRLRHRLLTERGELRDA